MFAWENAEQFNFHMVVKDHLTKRYRILNIGSGVVLNPEYDSYEEAEADFKNWDIPGYKNVLLDHDSHMRTLIAAQREKARYKASSAAIAAFLER